MWRIWKVLHDKGGQRLAGKDESLQNSDEPKGWRLISKKEEFLQEGCIPVFPTEPAGELSSGMEGRSNALVSWSLWGTRRGVGQAIFPYCPGWL